MGLLAILGAGRSAKRAARRSAGQLEAGLREGIGTFQEGDIRRFEQLSPLRDIGTEQFETGRQLTSAGADFQGRAPGFFDQAEGQFGFGGEQQAFGSQLQQGLPDILAQIQAGSTPGGFASNIEGLRDTFAPLIQRRQAESATQLQKLGLGRSSDVINRAADIDLETLIGAEGALFSRLPQLAQLQSGIAGQAFDTGRGGFGTGINLAGAGTSAFGAGTSAIGAGAGIQRGGGQQFLAGSPEESIAQIADLQAQIGGAKAQGTLGADRAKQQTLQNLINVGTSAVGGF